MKKPYETCSHGKGIYGQRFLSLPCLTTRGKVRKAVRFLENCDLSKSSYGFSLLQVLRNPGTEYTEASRKLYRRSQSDSNRCLGQRTPGFTCALPMNVVGPLTTRRCTLKCAMETAVSCVKEMDRRKSIESLNLSFPTSRSLV